MQCPRDGLTMASPLPQSVDYSYVCAISPDPTWIPACAGMTWGRAGMTLQGSVGRKSDTWIPHQVRNDMGGIVPALLAWFPPG